MAVVRTGGQVPLEIIVSPCAICCFLELDAGDRKWSLPESCREGILCPMHRSRLEEGACLFCGRRLAWLRMAGDPELAVCRPCLVQRKGEAVAQAVEAMQDGDTIRLIVS